MIHAVPTETRQCLDVNMDLLSRCLRAARRSGWVCSRRKSREKLTLRITQLPMAADTPAYNAKIVPTVYGSIARCMGVCVLSGRACLGANAVDACHRSRCPLQQNNPPQYLLFPLRSPLGVLRELYWGATGKPIDGTSSLPNLPKWTTC